MKNLATIKQLRSDVFKAKSAYHQAIIQNLQEIGEELPVSSGYEDEDEPKGCRVTSINQNNDEAFQAVVCGICYDEQKEPICKVAIHVIEWDGNQTEQWLGLTDLDDSAADYVLESIQWPESMSQGEAETAKNCKGEPVPTISYKGFDLRPINRDFQELLHEHENDTEVTGPSREQFEKAKADNADYGRQDPDDYADSVNYYAMIYNAWDDLCSRYSGLRESGLDWWAGASHVGFNNTYDLYIGTGNEQDF